MSPNNCLFVLLESSSFIQSKAMHSASLSALETPWLLLPGDISCRQDRVIPDLLSSVFSHAEPSVIEGDTTASPPKSPMPLSQHFCQPWNFPVLAGWTWSPRCHILHYVNGLLRSSGGEFLGKLKEVLTSQRHQRSKTQALALQPCG